MQWTILGAGAIGALFATQLKRIGEQVSLLDSRIKQAASRSITLTTLNDESTTASFQYESDLSLRNTDYLLVTTKVWQVIPALSPLVGKLSPTCTIILLHNGMGTAEWVQAQFPDNPLVAGVTSAGAYKKAADHVRHTGFGESWFGALNAKAVSEQQIIPVIENALGHAGWSESIQERQWQKLVINAVINPLTAALNQPNGALQTETSLVQNLCQEVAPLLAREGIHQTSAQLFTTVMSVVERTAQNYSSMQQDVQHHRPTEIDFITGYLLKQADKYQLDLPEHRALYLRIKALEKTYLHEEKS